MDEGWSPRTSYIPRELQTLFKTEGVEWNIINCKEVYLNFPIDFVLESSAFLGVSEIWKFLFNPYQGCFGIRRISDGNMPLDRKKLHGIPYQLAIKVNTNTVYESRCGILSYPETVDQNLLLVNLHHLADSMTANSTLTVCLSFYPDAVKMLPESVEKDTEDERKNSEGMQSLVENLKNLFLSGKDSDVTILVQNESFPGHKAILGIRSPVFSSMLHHDMLEKNSGEVRITDFTPDVIREFLMYLYTGQIETFTEDNMFLLYGAADMYDVPSLKSESIQFIKKNLSADNFCDALFLSLQYDDEKLLQLATEFFAQNLLDIIKTEKWETFLLLNPIEANKLYIKAAEINSVKWEEFPIREL